MFFPSSWLLRFFRNKVASVRICEWTSASSHHACCSLSCIISYLITAHEVNGDKSNSYARLRYKTRVMLGEGLKTAVSLNKHWLKLKNQPLCKAFHHSAPWCWSACVKFSIAWVVSLHVIVIFMPFCITLNHFLFPTSLRIFKNSRLRVCLRASTSVCRRQCGQSGRKDKWAALH